MRYREEFYFFKKGRDVTVTKKQSWECDYLFKAAAQLFSITFSK